MNLFLPRYFFGVALAIAALAVAAAPAAAAAPGVPRKALTSVGTGWAKVRDGLSQTDVLSLVGVPTANVDGEWFYSGGGWILFSPLNLVADHTAPKDLNLGDTVAETTPEAVEKLAPPPLPPAATNESKWAQLHAGMTKADVQKLLGEPNSEGVLKWYYFDGGWITFDASGLSEKPDAYQGADG